MFFLFFVLALATASLASSILAAAAAVGTVAGEPPIPISDIWLDEEEEDDDDDEEDELLDLSLKTGSADTVDIN